MKGRGTFAGRLSSLHSRALVAASLLTSLVSSAFGQAGGVPVYSPTRYVIVGGQIEQFHQKIKEFQGIVDVTKEQIQLLNRVSEAIQEVKGLAAGGVQGVVADLAKRAGIGDILNTAMDVQALASDTFKLYNSVANLPEHARREMERIGFSAGDLQDYLAHGIKYDTLQTLDADDWKAAAAHPSRMFTNGTLAGAVNRAQVLTGGDDLRPAYAAYVTALPPDAKVRLAPQVGLDLAAMNFSAWLKRTDSRMEGLLNFQKADRAVAGALDQKGSYSDDLQKRTAADAAAARLEAEALRRRSEAAGHEISAGAAVLSLRRELEAEAKARQNGALVVPPP